MTRTGLIACTLLASGLMTGPAFAGEAVFLRENPVVEGAQITLGDLFDISGDSADVVIARAPAPGSRTALDVGYVRRVAAEHDLDWANAAGVRRIAIARASRSVPTDMLTDLLEGELFAREAAVHEVQLANSALNLHAPVDSVGGPHIVSLNFDRRSGMLAAEVAPYEGAEPVRVTGRAYATVDVPVLSRAVAAGQRIRAEDITWMAQRSDRLRPDAVLDPNAIIGLETRRGLRANEPLRGYDLQQPLMVSRGELVTLTFEAPGIQLSVRARALEDAADGELARFVNLQSNRTVEALVDGPGRARVGSSPAVSF
ncbi:flagellar basal body P-ring formation chaperone FlgA [Maricaulis sp. CAU 1757]